METTNARSVEELHLVNQFDQFRRILQSPEYRSHLEKPLAHWALPSDRRLPLAFLGRRLGELIDTPFSSLAATAGVGRKKLGSLIMLLSRAVQTAPGDLPQHSAATPKATCPLPQSDGFDFSHVSEMIWDQWRTSVVRHGLGGEKLGRFAPSLRHMTRVIWNRSLGEYAHQTLAQIRAQKTHGEKRVRAILEVFHGLHVMIGAMGTQRHLVVRLYPTLIDQVERWVERQLQSAEPLDEESLLENYVRPLCDQVRIDANEPIVRLMETRLGFHGPITSVRQVARGMGLTRARVYQLLNEINDIMVVRWPNGRHLSYELLAKLHRQVENSEQPKPFPQFSAAVELFYPAARRGAEGSVEPAGASRRDRREASTALMSTS